ncbi:DUF6809 family protein [Paenibacillus apiarius]|uniref:DUF6809 family protein n=1 Tax=Paenibacillus apiarius TaxID=46240 RepID=UPI003B3B5FDE
MEANTGANWIGMSVDSRHEQGMLEVIREIATLKFLETSTTISEEPNAIAAEKKYKEALNKLSEFVGKDGYDFLSDYEAASNDLSSIEIEENFINGFIEGYRFLKQLQKSCGQGLS